MIVTTPQEIALLDFRKSVNFVKSLKVSAIGIIENMSGLVCPHCGKVTYYDFITHPDYMDEFMLAKFPPHNDLGKFSHSGIGPKAS